MNHNTKTLNSSIIDVELDPLSPGGGSESWTLLKSDEDKLRRWERKILRNIY